MEKHITQPQNSSTSESNRNPGGDEDFSVGTEVIYGIHGKCQVLGIEARSSLGKEMRFYKLEVQKSALSRSTKREPAIWLPVGTARQQGLRLPMSRTQAEQAMALLASREYYFNPNESWTQVYPKLEATLRSEGGPGFAQVYSYLYVLKRRQVVPSSDLVKLLENVYRILLRELTEALGETPRTLEDRMAKGLRQKLLADQ